MVVEQCASQRATLELEESLASKTRELERERGEAEAERANWEQERAFLQARVSDLEMELLNVSSSYAHEAHKRRQEQQAFAEQQRVQEEQRTVEERRMKRRSICIFGRSKDREASRSPSPSPSPLPPARSPSNTVYTSSPQLRPVSPPVRTPPLCMSAPPSPVLRPDSCPRPSSAADAAPPLPLPSDVLDRLRGIQRELLGHVALLSARFEEHATKACTCLASEDVAALRPTLQLIVAARQAMRDIPTDGMPVDVPPVDCRTSKFAELKSGTLHYICEVRFKFEAISATLRTLDGAEHPGDTLRTYARVCKELEALDGL
eukprot:TRINITY_DN5671_c0_g1_i2.p1 TRINITY_DN5671_c0_g1~~TRINITY_DN5671_c0_g1_i2.p1  ORF type:complete len:354 (+),score=77.65 TRINITY_DN5671_c0_g1_i2:106-1062(+)